MSSPSTLNSAYDEKLTQLLIEYKEFCLESVVFLWSQSLNSRQWGSGKGV